MGKKGEQRTAVARTVAEDAVRRLAAVGDVKARAMFGGYGIFADGTMFGLVNAAGVLHLRADDTTQSKYTDAGATRHGKMPYWTVPDVVLGDPRALRTWAATALACAQSAQRT